MVIAAHSTELFKKSSADLNSIKTTEWSVATDHIGEMIDYAKRIAPEHCYQLDSGLYFDSTTVPDYGALAGARDDAGNARIDPVEGRRHPRSEEHTSELQSLMRISYAVFCLKKKKYKQKHI